MTPSSRPFPALRRVLRNNTRVSTRPHYPSTPKTPDLIRHSSSSSSSSSSSTPPSEPSSMFKNTTPNYLKPPTYETPVESIKLDMDFYGIPHWGWAIFRTAYGSPEFDSSWEKLQARIKCQSATEMAEPGVPNEVAAGLNWVFLSDRLTLQGKTRHDARLKFLEWVAQQPRITDPRYGPPSRYLYFVHVDEEVLDSGGTPGEEPHFVKLVRCEERQDLVYDFVSREELRKYSEEEDGDEGWMRVAVDMLGAEFYDSLGDMPEYFYVYYRGHPNVVEW